MVQIQKIQTEIHRLEHGRNNQRFRFGQMVRHSIVPHMSPFISVYMCTPLLLAFLSILVI